MTDTNIQNDLSNFRPLIGEYAIAVTRCGVIERSGISLIEASGPDAVDFLQGMVSADVKALGEGQSGRAALLDTKGHILADMMLHRRRGSIYLETDAACLRRVLDSLNRLLIMEDVTLTDRSFEYGSLSIVGPKASLFLHSLTGSTVPVSHGAQCDLDKSGWVVNRSWPELERFDVWSSPARIEEISQRAIAAGEAAVGAKVAEMLRVEAGESVWGHELDETVLLPEAEIPDIISFTKGCYVGQEIIARIHARGHTNRVLRHLLFDKGADPVTDGALLYVEGEDREVARITSSARSVRHGGLWLAMGYVRSAFAWDGVRLPGRLVAKDGVEQGVKVTVLRIQTHPGR